MVQEVTDPNILAQLNSDEGTEVTDPNILAQLNDQVPPSSPPQSTWSGMGKTALTAPLRGLASLGDTALSAITYPVRAGVGRLAGYRPEGVADVLEDALGYYQPFSKGLEKAGVNYEYQGLPEKFLGRGLEFGIPGGAAGKAAKAKFIPSAISSFIGGLGAETGKQVAEQAGLGPKGTMAAEILGGVGGFTSANKLPGLIKNIGKVGKNIRVEDITKNILADKKTAQKISTKGYQSLFKEAKKAGAESVTPAKIDVKKLKDFGAQKKYYKGVEEFLKKPTVESAHKAQSDMGKLIRSVEKMPSRTSSQYKLIDLAEDAQKRLRGKIFETLNEVKPELANKYKGLTNKYAQDVVPYLESKALKDFQKGELRQKDLINALSRNKKFMAKLGSKYPGLEIRKNLKPLLKYGTYGGVFELARRNDVLGKLLDLFKG